MPKIQLIPIATYDRVSTSRQEAGAARERLRAAAVARGGRLVMEVEETGSGALNDRPGLLQVMAAARAGRVREVLVWKLDRWGRSALDLHANIQQLRQFGCSFVAVSQGLVVNGTDAISTLLLSVLAGVAEFERETIRDRTKLGLERARARGVVIGRPRSPEAPDPHQVLALKQQGESWSDIAELLGCTQSMARRALKTLLASPVEKGVKRPRRELV